MEAHASAIPVTEYAERRRRVLDALDGAAALVFGGSESGDSLFTRWKTDRLFWYLTGIDYESDAAVLFDPTAEDPEQHVTLFLRPRDPEIERWDGARAALDAGLRIKTGFGCIARTPRLPSRVTAAARRAKRLACLHPFALYNSEVSPDLAVYRKICERVPNVAIEDRTQLLPEMRAVKSPAELALTKQAIEASAAGYAAAMRVIAPGVSERAVAEALTAGFRDHGCEPAYEPIVGSGVNGTVLHYIDNDKIIEPGDLIVIDYAAACGGYASDVTRTLPATGTFTAEQRRLYEIVLKANAAAIGAARPGATFTQLQTAAREVFAEAGYEDRFIHGVGHHIGAEVHDVTPDGPLTPGMVLAIEPGIYLPDEGVGIRIEDDVLVTATGPEVLTTAIPKSVEAIETAMARR